MAGNTRPLASASALLWALALGLLAQLFSATPALAQFPTLPSKPSSSPPASQPAPAKPKPATKPKPSPDQLWEPGDEVIPPKPLPGGRSPGNANPAPGSKESDVVDAGGDDQTPSWSVLLMTFVTDDHVKSANSSRERIAARIPQLRDAFVRRVSQGSVVLVGKFTGPSDPAAQAKLKEVKQLVVDGQRPFPGAMLTRTSTDTRPPGPFDVKQLRARFPDVNPLYSLQVAAWSSFGEKSLTRKDIRASAEKYCKELRAKGFEAWVHHDDDTVISIVTVGHFDHNAYDSKSTLFSGEVEALMRKFPRSLVNGEEVLIPLDPKEDPKKPGVKTRPQGCRLVEIPK